MRGAHHTSRRSRRGCAASSRDSASHVPASSSSGGKGPCRRVVPCACTHTNLNEAAQDTAHPCALRPRSCKSYAAPMRATAVQEGQPPCRGRLQWNPGPRGTPGAPRAVGASCCRTSAGAPRAAAAPPCRRHAAQTAPGRHALLPFLTTCRSPARCAPRAVRAHVEQVMQHLSSWLQTRTARHLPQPPRPEAALRGARRHALAHLALRQRRQLLLRRSSAGVMQHALRCWLDTLRRVSQRCRRSRSCRGPPRQ